MAKANNQSASNQPAQGRGGQRRRTNQGPLAPAEAALAAGDTRRARALAKLFLAGAADTVSAEDRAAALALLERTRVDPVALAIAGAVLLVIGGAAFFGLFHGAVT